MRAGAGVKNINQILIEMLKNRAFLPVSNFQVLTEDMDSELEGGKEGLHKSVHTVYSFIIVYLSKGAENAFS